MDRKHIQLENGAILPNAHEIWGAASCKLNEAEEAISAMTSARNRIDFEEAWSRYVDSIEQFWTRFYDEGKEKFISFPPWAGKIINERKTDQALQYIYQARHKSQHGRSRLEWESPKLIIGRGFAGLEYGLRIFPDGTYQAKTVPSSPNTKQFSVDYSPGNAILHTIQNKRDGKDYLAPSMHLGKQLIDNSPQRVASITLAYYKNILKNAFVKFVSRE